jgi:ATP-dependent DNA helicase Q1
MSLSANRALRIIDAAVSQHNGTLTLPQAADLVRGNGGGSFATQETKGKGKGKISVEEVAGGKVTLSKDQTEQMLLKLLVDGYLKEQFHASALAFLPSFPPVSELMLPPSTAAYNVSSYLRPSSNAVRFTRLSPSQISSAEDLPISISMQVSVDGGKGKKRKSTSTTAVAKPAAKKQKKVVRLETDDEDEGGGAGSYGGSGGGGSAAFDLDDYDEDAFDYVGAADGEDADADALEALRQLEPSSDGVEVDEDGWAGVKTASKVKAGGRKKEVEVLELD